MSASPGIEHTRPPSPHANRPADLDIVGHGGRCAGCVGPGVIALCPGVCNYTALRLEDVALRDGGRRARAVRRGFRHCGRRAAARGAAPSGPPLARGTTGSATALSGGGVNAQAGHHEHVHNRFAIVIVPILRHSSCHCPAAQPHGRTLGRRPSARPHEVPGGCRPPSARHPPAAALAPARGSPTPLAHLCRPPRAGADRLASLLPARCHPQPDVRPPKCGDARGRRP